MHKIFIIMIFCLSQNVEEEYMGVVNMELEIKVQAKDKISWGLAMKRETIHFTWESPKNRTTKGTSKCYIHHICK